MLKTEDDCRPRGLNQPAGLKAANSEAKAYGLGRADSSS